MYVATKQYFLLFIYSKWTDGKSLEIHSAKKSQFYCYLFCNLYHHRLRTLRLFAFLLTYILHSTYIGTCTYFETTFSIFCTENIILFCLWHLQSLYTRVYLPPDKCSSIRMNNVKNCNVNSVNYYFSNNAI